MRKSAVPNAGQRVDENAASGHAPATLPGAGGGQRRTPDAKFATTLAHGLEILSLFHPDRPVIAHSELARRTGVSRSVTTRLCQTLVELGYLRRAKSGGYELGDRVLSLAYPILASAFIRERARPLMQELATDLRGMVSLVRIERTHAVYIEVARGIPTPRFLPDIGFSTPLVATAHGRALLSILEKEELAEVTARIGRQSPELWPALRPKVDAAIKNCATRGFCVSLGDWTPDTYAVAAPIGRSLDGRAVALNCGIPAYRVDRDLLETEAGPRLAALARVLRGMLD